MRIRLFIVLAFVLAVQPAAAGLDAARLPSCWSVTSTYNADAGTLRGFGQRFGVELEAIANYKVDAGGIPLQVNEVVCRSPEDAATVYRFFMSAREASPQKYQIEGDVVYEFLCDDYGVSAAAQYALGIRAPIDRLYRVTVGVAPLAASDGMKWNALFNALLSGEGVATLAGDFEFSSTLPLRVPKAEWGTPSYEFSVEPSSQSGQGDIVEVMFSALPRTQTVPRLVMTAKVPVRSFAPYAPATPVKIYDFTRPTEAWPTGHPLVARALEGFDEDWSVRRKIEHIQCWVFENIRYDGTVTGSRYGTARVLEQGFGHCWDKADVFVTLCRAAGIAAREVMGWIIVLESGHVWAEAYDPESGWLSVDATASWIGIDERYIPLFQLDDGRTPVVYTSKPDWYPLAPGE